MKNAMFVAMATLIAAFLSGCAGLVELQPVGRATILVKESELVKACKGEIGWADVSIVAFREFPSANVDGRSGKSEAPVAMNKEGLGAMHKALKDVANELPLFFCKDEEVKLQCFLDGDDAIVRLRAKLRVPIAYTNVLQDADLPRVMQFAVDKDNGMVSMGEMSANKRYGAYVKNMVAIIGITCGLSDIPADELAKIAGDAAMAPKEMVGMYAKQAECYWEPLYPVFMTLTNIMVIRDFNVEVDEDVRRGVRLNVEGGFSGLRIELPKGFNSLQAPQQGTGKPCTSQVGSGNINNGKQKLLVDLEQQRRKE